MNFEKNLDPKEAMHIGIKEFLIKKISEHMETYLSVKFRTEGPANEFDNTVLSWIKEGGAYIKLIKRDGLGFTDESKYPEYYVSYDSGGLHYGNCTVEEFLEKPEK